ncbi:MAG: hypothetical protein ACFFCD_03715 [Promethearchaeota archaeon]
MEAFKTHTISESKFVRLYKDEGKYFVELTANGYTVKALAGTTLKIAEAYYLGVINKLRDGVSMLEALHS